MVLGNPQDGRNPGQTKQLRGSAWVDACRRSLGAIDRLACDIARHVVSWLAGLTLQRFCVLVELSLPAMLDVTSQCHDKDALLPSGWRSCRRFGLMSK